MTLRRLATALLMASGLAASLAHANEAEIRKAMQARFPGVAVDSITKTPFPGIYEVVVGGRLVYTDEKTSYVFIGTLIDTRTTPERNLTAERTSQLMVDALSKATASAIKRVRGNGKRTIYTMEDPNCGYCKAFHKELAKLNDV